MCSDRSEGVHATFATAEEHVMLGEGWRNDREEKTRQQRKVWFRSARKPAQFGTFKTTSVNVDRDLKSRFRGVMKVFAGVCVYSHISCSYN